MPQQSNEGDIVLALSTLRSDPDLSVRKAAQIYKVRRTTLRDRRRGVQQKRDVRPPCKKLTSYEEESIVRYVIDLDS